MFIYVNGQLQLKAIYLEVIFTYSFIFYINIYTYNFMICNESLQFA